MPNKLNGHPEQETRKQPETCKQQERRLQLIYTPSPIFAPPLNSPQSQSMNTSKKRSDIEKAASYAGHVSGEFEAAFRAEWKEMETQSLDRRDMFVVAKTEELKRMAENVKSGLSRVLRAAGMPGISDDATFVTLD
ncbi:hypothetical protein EJ02DRAFT_431201 [Clathrospora elynae]|uniref:Uncharacterized protein n=1 Tax=Clathrospora elynae TaxID=706981 RepID=A0A6A5T2Q6_9PLEO|nr:hypothetical protein EJ02DRAFT_431201 [Clathrospora elynae]